MTIDAVSDGYSDGYGDDGCSDAVSLNEWLQSEKAVEVQRELEEKIMEMLSDPSSNAFQMMAIQFAWIGSQPAQRALLEKEIIALRLDQVEQCGLLKDIRKASKKVGHFISDHVVEIAVGVAICATGVGIAIVAGYSLSITVGGVVVAGAGAVTANLFQENEVPKIPQIPFPDPQACSKEELATWQQGLPSSTPTVQFPSSVNEVLVTADGAWVNGQYFPTNNLMQNSRFAPVFDQWGYPQSDWRTFAHYKCFSEQQTSISCQDRGRTALALGDYKTAVQDFQHVIDANSKDAISHLEWAAALFGLERYDDALQAYKPLQNQTANPLSISEFTIGFATGVPKGVYESGEGLVLFFADMIKHPVQTSKQVLDSVTTLVDLARRDEWGTIAETLSPELYILVTEWDILSSRGRGELAGYVLGKYGADILVPGALGKIASKSARSAQELVEVCKNLQIAKETLVLETAVAGVGNGAKIAEIIETSKKAIAMGEELGLTSQEIGQLQQAGKLEETITTYKKITLSMQDSYDLAIKADELLKPHTQKFMPEPQARELIHQAGIKTFLRPSGIPENFRVRISDKGGGIIYMHPEHTHTSIRVMPGKAHSPLPYQQKPYVIHVKNGQALDKFGNKLSSKGAPEAHIPYEEFVYRD